MIEVVDDPAQVADAVAVVVREAPRVHLVHHAVAPIGLVHGRDGRLIGHHRAVWRRDRVGVNSLGRTEVPGGGRSLYSDPMLSPSPSSAGPRLRIGVAGLGAVAQAVHLPLLSRLDSVFEIAAICDLSPSILARVGDRYRVSPGTRYASVEALLDGTAGRGENESRGNGLDGLRWSAESPSCARNLSRTRWPRRTCSRPRPRQIACSSGT